MGDEGDGDEGMVRVMGEWVSIDGVDGCVGERVCVLVGDEGVVWVSGCWWCGWV